MEKIYTISEIGKLLGLSNDAIRFYEKKGLVHPSINPENKYRIYTIHNVLELLDIIYYRHLDFSVSDIYELSKSLDPKRVYTLVEQQRKNVERKIRYEQQLLKKITYIQSLFENIKTKEGVCSLKVFPASFILFENKDKEQFFHHEIQHISTDQFVLCSIYRQYLMKDNTLKKIYTYVTLDETIMEELGMYIEKEENKFLLERKSIHMNVKMENGKIQKKDIAIMKEYAKNHHLKTESFFFAREIPLTFYHDTKNYYAEIYLPLKK